MDYELDHIETIARGVAVKDGKILLCKAKCGSSTYLPGGHIELGETGREALVREIKEETGLTIYSPQLCGIKDWYENECRYVVLFYKATRFEGNLLSSSEGEVRWEDIENLSSLNLSLDMNDMVRVFTEDDLSEFFYYQRDNKWIYDLK